MTTKQLTERDLVIALRDAKKEQARIELELERASDAVNKAKDALIELLTSQGATATAKYDGLGSASLVKPRLYANCKKENEALLFQFLEQESRTDLIKQTVNSQSLSGLVKEMVELGQAVPEFIAYYLKADVRLND